MKHGNVSYKYIKIQAFLSLLKMSEARPTEDVSASYQKSYDILKEANVVNLMTDEHKKMSDLWLEKPCIIYVVRRPGCTMCREQGLLLQEKIAEKCKSLGINLVATCKERVGGEEFVKDYWKDGQLYLDADWASFKALGEGTCLEAKWYEIFTPTFISRVFESKKKAKNVSGGHNLYGVYN